MSLFYIIYQSSLNYNSFQDLRDVKSLRMYNSLFDTINCWNCWGWSLQFYLPLVCAPKFGVPFCVPASHRTQLRLTNIRCLILSYVPWEKSYLYVAGLLLLFRLLIHCFTSYKSMSHMEQQLLICMPELVWLDYH